MFILLYPATLEATNCTFTGGWQGAFMRGGTSTFDQCNFNLNVSSSYGSSNRSEDAVSWGDGNQAPSAALTIGNKSNAYAYEKKVTLKNGCTFSVKMDNADSQEYPSVYINTQNAAQKVTFIYDASSETAYNVAGKGLVNKLEGNSELVTPSRFPAFCQEKENPVGWSGGGAGVERRWSGGGAGPHFLTALSCFPISGMSCFFF